MAAGPLELGSAAGTVQCPKVAAEQYQTNHLALNASGPNVIGPFQQQGWEGKLSSKAPDQKLKQNNDGSD